MKSIIVVDDFYTQPMEVHEMALSAKYQDVRSLNYPGFQSERSFATQAMASQFRAVVGEEILVDPQYLTFGKFRVMLAATGTSLKIHIDGHADWTGLVYLNHDEDCEGGTAFYRHKKSGLHGTPTCQQLKDFGFDHYMDFEKDVIEPDTLNPDAWEQTGFIGMKFNRLVLFRGNQLFHSHTSSFGDSVDNGRLTQLFFFNNLEKNQSIYNV